MQSVFDFETVKMGHGRREFRHSLGIAFEIGHTEERHAHSTGTFLEGDFVMQSQTGTAQVRRLAKQAGFSLVELMVVVAIIGVLATIAIPRVNRFIAKSRQSEAQVNLSSLYTFNKNFFVEFNGYTTSFGAMGYQPEGQLRYNVGFSQGATGPNQYTILKDPNSYTNPPQNAITNSLAACPVTNAATAVCVSLRGATNAAPPAINSSQIAANFSSFRAQALAVLVANGGTLCGGVDSWTITDSKNLANPCDGTQN